MPAFPALDRLLKPSSVALVGASANPRSLGGRTLANLRGFPGRLYLVNPNQAEIDGLPCHGLVSALPEPVDCVVLAIPSESVESVVRECAGARAGAVVVLASGYAETGTQQGEQAQQRLAHIAAEAGMRIVGPNCVGVASHVHGVHAAFAEFPKPHAGADRTVGLVSQSGAVALALSQAAERGVSFSHVLTCGNSCDVDVADYVAFLADESSCNAIALAFEGLRDPARLQPAIERARARAKPVAICRLGTSPAGREAVRFHTGTDPGPASLLEFVRGMPGVAVVDRVEALIDTAVFLAKAPPPNRAGVAVLSGSGGTGILSVDAAMRWGVATPQPGAATTARLAAAIPYFGSPRNPCDVTAQATRNPESLLACAEALLDDPAYGALVIPWGRSQSPALLPSIGALGAARGKPVCIVWMSQLLESGVTQQIEQNGTLTLFRSLDQCFAAISAWCHPLAAA
jgi:acetyl-CoA synthetase